MSLVKSSVLIGWRWLLDLQSLKASFFGVEVTDMEPKVLKALLHCIYKMLSLKMQSRHHLLVHSVDPSAPGTLAAKLLGAADKYKLPRLSLMWESMLCKDNISRSDGFDYLREHCPSLQSELLKTNSRSIRQQTGMGIGACWM
ncbi:hypothetical protein Bca101_084928 [Brassica carinata]